MSYTPPPCVIYRSGNSSKSSVIPTKLSQKQRKMIAMANREANFDGPSAKSPPGVTSVKLAKGWCVSGHFVLYFSFYKNFSQPALTQ